MNLRAEDHRAAYEYLADLESGPDPEPDPRGHERIMAHSTYFGGGSGGPTYYDGYNQKPAPTPIALINKFRGVSYACARLNAHAVAKTPLRLYVKTKTGQAKPRGLVSRAVPPEASRYLQTLGYVRSLKGSSDVEEVTEHPLIDLLHKVNPSPDNPFPGVISLIYFTQLLKEICGRMYWWFDKDGLDIPSQIWPMTPRDLKPVPFMTPRDDGRIIDHYIDVFGEYIAPEQIAQFRFLSPMNPYVGAYGPLEAAFQELGIRDQYGASVSSILGNVFHPSAIISSKDPDRPIGEDIRPRLESDLKKKFTRSGSGSVLIANGSLQYDPWVQQPTDIGGLEVSKDAKSTIANCFDVPMTLLEMQLSNRASAEAGNYAHAVKAVEPRCEFMGEELTHWTHRLAREDRLAAVHGALGWDRLFWAFDCPVPEDEERRAKITVGYAQLGYITGNEVRAEQGRDPLPFLDEPWIASSLRQPSEKRVIPAAPGEKPTDDEDAAGKTKKKKSADAGDDQENDDA